MSPPSRHTAGVTTRLILQYVRAKAGEDGVRRMLQRAGESRPPPVLDDERTWSTYDQKINLLEAAAAVLDDPLVARHVGESVLDHQVGSAVKLLLRAMGSPGQVLRNIARTAPKFSTVCTMTAPAVERTRAVVTYELHEGFTPHRMDCDLNIGFMSQVSVLFGLPPARIAHDECQVLGADRCVYEVSWIARRRMPWRRRAAKVAYLSDQLQTLSERTESLQTTIADLASPDDVDAVLARIAARAGEAVRAQAYVLAVRDFAGAPLVVHHDGLTDGYAQTLAAEISGETSGEGDDSRLVVDVASGNRYYGRLAALYPNGGAFFPEERRLLAAYARHAAVALDAATALEQARARGETAEALFDLARSLAAAADENEVAARLAEAAPRIVGASRCVVGLWDPAGGAIIARAVHGFSEEHASIIRSLRVSVSDTPELTRMMTTHMPRFFGPDHADPFVRKIMAMLGSSGFFVAPIVMRGEFAGCIGLDNQSAAVESSPVSISRVKALADQAAISFENVRLLKRLTEQAYRDALTGLPNAALFKDRLGVALAHARRSHETVAVMFLDLDRFKNVNDNLGHSTGDKLLTAVADRLLTCTRSEDTVSRMGGDEFTVLLPSLGKPEDVAAVAQKILDAFREPFVAGPHELFVTPSIGIAVYPTDGVEVEDLLKHADIAMYRAKEEGRNTYQMYTRAMNVEAFERFALETNLHKALERREFVLHYQPQIDVETGAITGAEALVRWKHEKLGLVLAGDFLPLAEETGLIVALDEWVLRSACEQGRAWLDDGLRPIRLAVNLSARMLQSPSLPNIVLRVLQGTGFPAELLQIEMPESITMLNPEHVAGRLWMLASAGVHFAIDDFGAGYTFLSHLREFPIESLKLDKSLVRTMTTSEDDAAIVRAVIALAHSLKIAAVAEGAETETQREFLSTFGCDRLQGFLISPAVPPEDFAALLRDRSPEGRAISEQAAAP